MHLTDRRKRKQKNKDLRIKEAMKGLKEKRKRISRLKNADCEGVAGA